ncbi:M23 family metallopeptidase [Rickettsiales endosymbiont of Paramecium tredecaurelia]|uniref:peptidoglycan DD-metalloendopeptidase family protein n=1 Tax=Candidatus Sarmatiella mevalonica TaxID=2770581 RepID=UPI0019213DC1|nr:peptidoglycan DD-metalloendopeptidase family protein [Candidatus Sarmatiella mevalonica]MBL3284992.1 M23 family metallopeptidase [Candidatus Sarmatiella mevalonica]
MLVLLLALVAVLCQGCANQEPAPIEYYADENGANHVITHKSRQYKQHTEREYDEQDFAQDLHQILPVNNTERIEQFRGRSGQTRGSEEYAQSDALEAAVSGAEGLNDQERRVGGVRQKQQNSKENSLEQLDKMLSDELKRNKNISSTKTNVASANAVNAVGTASVNSTKVKDNNPSSKLTHEARALAQAQGPYKAQSTQRYAAGEDFESGTAQQLSSGAQLRNGSNASPTKHLPPQTDKKIIYHEVGEGETLESLASKYQVSSQEIAQINDIESETGGRKIRPGQLLKLYVSDELIQSNNAKPVYDSNGVDGSRQAANTNVTSSQHSMHLESAMRPEPQHPKQYEYSGEQNSALGTGSQGELNSQAASRRSANTHLPNYEQEASEHSVHASFIKPVEGGKILVGFQQIDERGKKNNGVNIQAPKGSNVVAICDGKIVYVGNDSTFGNMLVLEAPNGLCVAYAHLDKIEVNKGQVVRSGEVIGKLGATGIVTSPQLHLAIRHAKNNRSVNPLEYFAY